MLSPKGAMYNSGVGNCNVNMWNGLYSFAPHDRNAMIDALWDMTTTAADSVIGFTDTAYGGFGKCSTVQVTHKPPTCGIWLFAQGSDHDIEKYPYGPNLKALIEELKLGTVIGTLPAPNPMHAMRPGILYAWNVDKEAIAKWWEQEKERRTKLEKGTRS